MDKSYFDKKQLEEKAKAIQQNTPAPEWLSDVLRLLAEHGEHFPRQKDPERFVIEYIYPH